MRGNEIDALTGLCNRRGLDRLLADVAREHSPRGGRTDRWRSMVVIDIDRLKGINDRYGHPTGDAVIVDVAQRIAGCAGDQALVARTGGDGFLVLSPHEPQECVGFFGLLAHDLHGGEVGGVTGVTLSAGAAQLRPDDIAGSRRDADLAMFQAKSEGRDRIVLQGPATDDFVDERHDLLDRMLRMQSEIVRLFDATHTDALTGVGNVKALDRHVEILERRRSSSVLAVLFIDLDRFHAFNRLRGHFAGDEALQRVAEQLLTLCRDSDVILSPVGGAPFRKGGEEFVLVAPVPDGTGALALGERVRAAVEGLALEHGAPDQPVLTATIGISLSDAAVGPADALREAAVMMTRLKNAGRRNCVGLVDPDDRPAPDELPHESPREAGELDADGDREEPT